MITELTIEDPDRTPCKWWPKVDAYRGRDRFEFSPRGLTVLWGPNGSGKSTLLKVIARLTHCEQGGVPLVTETSVMDFVEGYGDDQVCRDGATIKTDGKPVHYLDPGSEPGMMGGHFDWDFGGQGLQSVLQRSSSSGQQVTMRMNRILAGADKSREVAWKIRREAVNEVWQEKMDVATRCLERNVDEDGPPTMLLDEPTRSIEIPREAETWLILATQRKFQIIAATHSVFAVNLPGTTYIDVVPGYLEKCREALKHVNDIEGLAKHLDEKYGKQG